MKNAFANGEINFCGSVVRELFGPVIQSSRFSSDDLTIKLKENVKSHLETIFETFDSFMKSH